MRLISGIGEIPSDDSTLKSSSGTDENKFLRVAIILMLKKYCIPFNNKRTIKTPHINISKNITLFPTFSVVALSPPETPKDAKIT